MTNAYKDILENFFGMILENSINDDMMEFSYKFPHEGMKEYALEICDIPFSVFLEYINKYQDTDDISADCVSQFSKLDDCLLGFCEATDNMRRPLTFEEIGERLQDDGVYRNSVANIKYGENHSKMALQFGLAQCRYNYWYISALGKVFSQLPKEKQDALMIRTLLRNKLYALIFTRLQNHDVSIENILRNVNLSDSTRTRRLSSVKRILTWYFDVLYKEKFFYQHKIIELPLSNLQYKNLPINYARRAHIELLENGAYKDKYLSLLNRIPRLSEEEEIDLYKKYKKGDLEAYHALCEACLPVVNTLANTLVNQYPDVDVLDLIGEGVCGLCTAVTRFSPLYNARLITYAMHIVRHYMYHYINHINPFIHIPADIVLLNKKISKISEKYYAEDKYISFEEIVDLLQFPLDKANACPIISNLEVVNVGLSCAFDNFKSEEFNYDNLYFESLSHDINCVLKQLTTREADILRSYYGIGVPEKTIDEIGVELNLTRERVRQIKEKAILKLKTSSISGILRTYLGEDLFFIDETISKQRKQCENNDYNIEQPKRTDEYLTPNIETPVVTNVIKKEYLVKNRKLFYAYPSDELIAFAKWARSEGTVVNGINYKLFPTEKVASVILKVEGSIEGSLIIPNKIKVDEDEYVVSYVGTRAFYYNSELSFVVIPRTVTIIRKNAFEGCSSLKKISLPDSLDTIGENAFLNCESLGSISLPDSVMTIGTHAFKGCSSLTIVSLPEKLRTLTLGMFTGCVSLSSIRLSYELDKIESYVFYKCQSLKTITIPQRIKQICHHTFDSCYSLEEVQLPDRLFEIEYNAFYECTSLKSINLPESLIKIGAHAFEGCSSIETIKIPSSVNSIGKQAFANCSNLKSIILSNNIVKIGRRVFDSCNSLERIVVPKGKREYYCKLGLEQYRNLIYEV